ncbi:MAG: hypothetical protein A2V88_08880 [Elusimicrobia bacterium RBG_16_66_12]|nr:MAG: hypothetical protein A2V88_08880 [Elusimicrobia bacterium RBG_16_66_12]
MPRDVRRTHNLRQNAHRLEAALKTALTQGGLVVVDRAKETAPEDTGMMTRSVSVGQPQVSGGRVRVVVGPHTDYAKYTELERYIAGKQLGPYSVAKGARWPWLGPALREKKDEVAEIIRASVAASLRAIARSS